MSDNPFPRRAFLRGTTALAGATGLVAGSSSAVEEKGDTFSEPLREIPVRKDADVIVCGAGPAGVAAALSAARAGANVRLFEVHGCLGGVWTSGLLTYIFDFDKPGITREISSILEKRGARSGKDPSRFVYDPEEMKVLLEELCLEAGITVQLFTRVTAAYRKDNRLHTIVTESKSGRQAWEAPVFIDATGDGDLGALAGCEWEVGQEKECPCQPLTMNALAVVRDVNALGDYISFHGTDSFQGKGGHITAVEAFKKELKRAGVVASYGHPTIFHVRDDLVMLMLNHEYGIKPWEADAISEATMRSRAEIFRIVRALNQLGGPWEGLQIATTAEQIGVRDGRRIQGRYRMTRDDLVTGARYDDAVARVTFGVDIHAASKEANEKEAITRANTKAKPYDIPLRALIAKDVDGLMMAGRCISGDFIAHASYRVTGNAVAMGEAAGVVAALAASNKRLPHQIPWQQAAELRDRIQRAG